MQVVSSHSMLLALLRTAGLLQMAGVLRIAGVQSVQEYELTCYHNSVSTPAPTSRSFAGGGVLMLCASGVSRVGVAESADI